MFAADRAPCTAPSMLSSARRLLRLSSDNPSPLRLSWAAGRVVTAQPGRQRTAAPLGLGDAAMDNGAPANGAAKRRRRRGGMGARAASGASLADPPQTQAPPGRMPAPPPMQPAGGGARQMSSTTAEHLTGTRFSDLPGVSPLTKRWGPRPARARAARRGRAGADAARASARRALAEVMRYQQCTDVQAASLPVCLRGADACVKAKTGTGKTLAFLIPAFERLQADAGRRRKVGALVVSPTRELATQIGEEAKALATFHGFHVQVIFGGTNISRDVARLQERTPDVLVATPGRLNDHLQNGTLAPAMSELRVLVLDEADRLLDMGFR